MLELSGIVNVEAIKKVYRRACMKYHPDRNPSGEHMMKLINAAYDALRDYTDDLVCGRGS
ncbi:MAG: DnaJ domain-containing protein [Proteobacteria bacterium]|nr:DnaJ domain-containing protein [Pseudomonadota bacterium]